MKIKVYYTDFTTISKTQNFSIVVKNPCLTDTLTIDPSKFASPAMTYNVRSAASTLSWTDSNAASAGGYKANCGTFTWTVTKTDGATAIDTIFTGDYT